MMLASILTMMDEFYLGKQLKSSGIAIYGPRTTITLAVDNMPYAHEFLLVDDFSANHGQWIKTNEFT
jgi:hypothetical protein